MTAVFFQQLPQCALWAELNNKYKGRTIPFLLRELSPHKNPITAPLTLILWTRGAKRNTNSSTVAMEFWKNFLLLFSSSSVTALGRGWPGDPWFSAWWIKALLLPPQLEPLSPPKRSLLQSWGASSSIQWRVWSSFVSATPSLSWCPVWKNPSHYLTGLPLMILFRVALEARHPAHR